MTQVVVQVPGEAMEWVFDDADLVSGESPLDIAETSGTRKVGPARLILTFAEGKPHPLLRAVTEKAG